ncbi:MAG: cell division protein ZipA C-terminal FtsZ-binding domain-containing protein [Halomonas sp.]|nr:cell division protein ZipA C-terminal FtsZ-binding domain-containing protein [Halomonas sp.]MDN6298172.1 cell division protein ZipA C-terminal FtsZ-binding domain-containing protein [Halomonas sp.]MDN6314618.1 cell division protein ZipA C-terminal FtsZ-binding domain-containing protein [Halomonas sp.]MDN6335742.1 cell division protein ZipA C-terminal FtsZ-binding domain-containing protein [Halomonas sp.]
MELREWLIILGLALVSLIVIDGVRRLQRQRRVPRLDQAGNSGSSPDEAAREAELDWELPNGGARVVKPADYSAMSEKPKLKRRSPEHAGPSRVLSEFRRSASSPVRQTEPDVAMPQAPQAVDVATEQNDTQESVSSHTFAIRADEEDAKAHQVRYQAEADQPVASAEESAETDAAATAADADIRAASANETGTDETRHRDARPVVARRRQLRTDTVGEYDDEDDEEYRLVDFEGMGRSVKKHLAKRQKEKQHARKLKQEEKARRAEAQAREQAERQARKQQEKAQQEQEEKQRRLEEQQAAEAEQQRKAEADRANTAAVAEAEAAAEMQPEEYQSEEYQQDVYQPQSDEPPAGHPVLEKALRNDVPGGQARNTLADADEIIVISVMSRDAEGFDGIKLLQLLMACGLRYSRGMGVFHRFETESEDSELQFSMVNVVKPGSFPVEAGEPFTCPGITLLMPLPGAEDSSAAFEAMVETAMVVVRHMGGELKDENQSVMTAQTIEFARQRVHEFERRHRLHRQLKAQ